jgi:hypothetical protein
MFGMAIAIGAMDRADIDMGTIDVAPLDMVAVAGTVPAQI